jgi:hypothetical protein
VTLRRHTKDIEPFTIEDGNHHELFVLAAVFELRRPWKTSRDSADMEFTNRADAREWQARLAEGGVPMRLAVRVIDAIDFTAAIEAKFGETENRGVLRLYREGWCGHIDLPRRERKAAK